MKTRVINAIILASVGLVIEKMGETIGWNQNEEYNSKIIEDQKAEIARLNAELKKASKKKTKKTEKEAK